MALRVMQIFLPEDSDQDLHELLEGRAILGRWRDSDNESTVLHLLVPAEETEPIMDRCEERFSGVEGFHVVLFPVEAVLPRPESQAETQRDGTASDKDEAETPKGHRISREELHEEVMEGLDLSRVYVGMTILSAIVAAVGLMRDDVAVIIGAMVIAPLLGPNVALSLGTTLGDMNLIRRALLTSFAGIALAFCFAVIVGLAFTVKADMPAISARTEVNVTDIFLALAAGAAGTLAFTRGLSGAVIGVMVAVALVPPLVVCGMLVGEALWGLAFGAFLLTAANVICVNLAGVAVFLIQGVRPRSWWEAERAKAATVRATIIWTALLALLVLILWVTRS